MLISRHEFQIFADYHQFYLEDENSSHNTGDIWSEEAYNRMLAIEDGLVAVGTGRNEMVPVSVEFHNGEPNLELGKYSRVNECSLQVSSSKLILEGCTEYTPDAARIIIEPSIYRVRILYGNLETVTDEWEGEDFYILQLWKDLEMRGISRLKW